METLSHIKTYGGNTLCSTSYLVPCNVYVNASVSLNRLTPSSSPQEDVVEANIVARIKLYYGHFEVWSLWVIHQHRWTSAKERGRESGCFTMNVWLKRINKYLQYNEIMLKAETTSDCDLIWRRRQTISSTMENVAIELQIMAKGKWECESDSWANWCVIGCNIWQSRSRGVLI